MAGRCRRAPICQQPGLPMLPPVQMELHLQEMSAELADRLPEASLAQLDELAAQLEGVEEKLAGLKVLCLA